MYKNYTVNFLGLQDLIITDLKESNNTTANDRKRKRCVLFTTTLQGTTCF